MVCPDSTYQILRMPDDELVLWVASLKSGEVHMKGHCAFNVLCTDGNACTSEVIPKLETLSLLSNCSETLTQTCAYKCALSYLSTQSQYPRSNKH